MLYSPTANAFFPIELVPVYEAAGTMPSDAAEVSASIVEMYYRSAPPDGKMLAPGNDGLPTWGDLPAPSAAEMDAAKCAVVQVHLDRVAQSYRYDNILSACSYAEEPAVERFQSEGRALRAWRSLVWQKAFDILEGVKNGGREMPSDEELLLELPKFVMP